MGVFDDLFSAQESKGKYKPPIAQMSAGMQDSAGNPKNLSTWRFASDDRATLEKIVELFGGEIRTYKTPRKTGEHVITTAYDVEGVIESERDVEVAAILWKDGRPYHKCNYRSYLFGTVEGSPGEPCSCAGYAMREIKRRSRDGEGPAPAIRVDFTVAQDRDMGKIRFKSSSFGLLQKFDAFVDEIKAAGEPVVVSLSKAYRSWEDEDTGELVETREIVPTVTGTLNDEIAS
ncbi:hypothetical protein [Streptomyces sp. NPDC007063]|uniref:hypothetical protein n=1 Tax=Streptomyces sp. NPDC007063 TaxID=3364772 RepID=UPI0036757C9D